MVFRNVFHVLCRSNKPPLTPTHRRCHAVKNKLKTGPKTNDTTAPDVIKFIGSPEYDRVRERLPKSLFVKYRTPETIYLINKDTARFIVHTVAGSIREDDVLVEVNPGPRVLTEELLKSHANKLHLFETSGQFNSTLKALEDVYPDRVRYKTADFFGMWKLAFKDKMDDGTRMKELLGDLEQESNGKGLKVLGAMPTLNFIKHLIFNVLFHNTTNMTGHLDLFIVMPSYNYAYLLEDNKLNHKNMYRATPALFQVLFDCKVLAKVSRTHFLPWQHQALAKKKITSEEDDYMLIVNIRQKSKLPCSAECLPLLWYFFRPHLMFKVNRIIPSLEQWIPGCGVWLISGQDPPDTDAALAPGPDDASLPHMTIFTQYGDLNIQQKVTVFKRFVSWPEFNQCPFRANMENNLPKSISGIDEKEDTRVSNIEETDDIHHDSDDEKHP